MTVTLMKSTIHRSLHAFDTELERAVKKLPFTRNAILVSHPLEHAISYMYANKGLPIPREVLVVGDEDKQLHINFIKEGETILTLRLDYPHITHFNGFVLDYLIDGTIPKAEG